MRVDIIPAVFVAGVLSITGGAWVGYHLSSAARAALKVEAAPPPIDAAPPQVEVGELSDGVLRLPVTVIQGRRRVFFGSVIAPPPIPTIKFFDFKHAICDTAESVHGQVVRCVKPSR